jgi:hypothetical protein
MAKFAGTDGGSPSGAQRLTKERLTEAHNFVKEIVDDPQYRLNLKARALAGNLAPNLEALLFYYRFGKPTDNVHIETATQQADLSALTDEQLSNRALAVAQSLKRHREALEARGPSPDIGVPTKTPDRVM